MERILTYEVTSAYENISVSEYLRKHGYSRAFLICLKKMEQSILVNGTWVYVTHKLHEGDILTIHITENTSSENIVPVSLPLSVIYEDEDILLVNKPADMPIHPSQNNYENTLANAVAYYYKCQNIPYTFRCLNRLDRDTSGLVLLAKHKLSSTILSQQMLDLKIEKEYRALAMGHTETQNTICLPIARVSDSLITRCVNLEHGEMAVTHYKTLKHYDDFSYISLLLETGRTHQIRVHMAYINHPLLGDFLYNPQNTKYIKRQALHSYRLSFFHPITKKPMEFTAPIPYDMQCLLE